MYTVHKRFIQEGKVSKVKVPTIIVLKEYFKITGLFL
jgi:hypothetical protein